MRFLSFLPLLLFFVQSNGQIFAPAKQVSEFVYSPSGLASMDIDADGDLDLVSSTVGDNTIVWYPNLGNQQFGPRRIISQDINRPSETLTADVDGDGLEDLIISNNYLASEPNDVYWIKNLGVGDFASAELIANDEADLRLQLLIGDIDNDGDLDLMTYEDGNEIGLFIFDSNSGFGPRTPLVFSTLSDCRPSLVDINDDGNLDILTAHTLDKTLTAFYGNGAGQFDSSEELHQSTLNPFSVFAHDFDTDGDVDILMMGGSNIDYLENLGGASFEGEVPNFFHEFNSWSRMKLVDIDNNGYFEIAGSYGDPEGFVRMEIDGSGAAPTLINSNHSWTYWFEAADFTGNGSNELIISRAGDGYNDIPELIWGETAERIGVYEFSPNASFLTDFNGDGLEDLLTLSHYYDQVNLFANDGDGSFEPVEVIYHEPTHYPISSGHFNQDFEVSDMDGDGDPDILLVNTYNTEVCWLENNGNGQIIDSHCFAQSDFGAGVHSGDLDGDGDMDVVVRYSDGFGPPSVYSKILLNDGSGGLSNSFVLNENTLGFFHLTDINGDGSLDILATAYNLVVWYENDGAAGFTAHFISGSTGSYGLSLADLDGDGDVDLLDRFDWFQNDGSGNFSPAVPYSTSQGDERAWLAEDIDLDGDQDLISREDGSLQWRENDGLQNFSNPDEITPGMWLPKSSHLLDVDQDGDLDVVSRWGDMRILLSENLTIDLGCPADINGDDQVDVNDFIMFNSAFASSCLGCPEDISGEGVVDVNDFLILNSMFGQLCD